MREPTRQILVQAIKDHPAVVKAAITGSLARRGDADGFSDLDALLVTNDFARIADVRSWLTGSVRVLLCAFHRSHYCSVLLDDFQKLDLAVYTADDPPTQWVVHDFEVIKGGGDFEAQLAEAARRTREQGAAHLNPDVSIDNVLLLLVTASRRIGRGELLSAHGFIAMACDMIVALDARQQGLDPTADCLDPRRRLEWRQLARAAVFHEVLFVPPGAGIVRFAQYLATEYRGAVADAHRKVLDHLLEPATKPLT